jgi:hypothetical protein
MPHTTLKLFASLYLFTIATISFAQAAQAQERPPTEAEIRLLLVRASIAAYAGNCPCPENVDRAGRRCGGRSAYRRPGGESPLCYPGDVTDEMIGRYRERLGRR